MQQTQHIANRAQEYVAENAQMKVALQDMMRAEDTEDVVDMMSELSCSSDQIQVTPDVARKTTSRAGND